MATTSRCNINKEVGNEEKKNRSSDSIDSERVSTTDVEKQEDERTNDLTPELEVQVDDEATEGHRLSTVVSRVLSRASIKSNAGPPPDGGLQAWIMVACCHLVIMNTWGFINSYGVFQTYYATTLNRPPSDISWIGSIQVFLLFFIGAFTGRMTDAGYFSQVFLLGSALQVLGIFAAANATQYWQFFLSQGIAMGLGNGCLFCPSVALVSTYFSNRRAIAIGIAACGSATGGLVFPSIARQMLPTAGFPWAMRTIGFVQLAALVTANMFMKPRISPRKTGALVEWAAFKELEYTFYAAGSFFSFLGVYFAFYYISSFTRDILGASLPESLNLLLVLNGVGAIGRLIPNYLADVIGPVNVFIPVALLSSISTFAWIDVHDEPGIFVWAAFFGMVAGGIQALFPAGLSSLTTDLRKAGTRMGMVFTIVSFAVLTGPPVEGALIRYLDGQYTGAQIFAGSVLLLGTGFMTAARIVRTRKVMKGIDSDVKTWWEVKV